MKRKIYVFLLLGMIIPSIFANTGKFIASQMMKIPSGSYSREDGKTVQVASFGILNKEITWSQFKAVKNWGEQHGYSFEGGNGQADLPVQNITWYDAIKWCNALSEMEGKDPVYFTDKTFKEPYRKGRTDLTSDCVKWLTEGYRLPTEAEWEYAYRANSTGRYYWGDFARQVPVNHEYAVFHVWGTLEIDGGPMPGATKRPNNFGLYDMAGNVEEWAWDRYSVNYTGVETVNPKGVDVGSLRILRGGGFVIDRQFGAADRHPTYPCFVNCDNGFRIACSNSLSTPQILNSAPILSLNSNDIKAFSSPESIRDIREDTDEATADRIFALLNPDANDLKEAFNQYRHNNYQQALAALCEVYTDRLIKSNLDLSGQPDITRANRWRAIYKQNRKIVWAGTNADVDDAFDLLVQSAASLPLSYVKTKDVSYRDAYFWLLDELALYSKPTWDVLSIKEKGTAGNPRDAFYAFIGFDAGFPLRQLEGLAYILKHAPEREKVQIPPRMMANILYSSVVDRLSAGLQDDRSNVPNQTWGNALNILKMSIVCDNFRDAKLWHEEGVYRIRKAAGTVMKDGTDLEPSINYNQGLFKLIDELNNYFPKPFPGWLAELNKRTEYRRYMYVSLTSPLGSFASIGNQSDEITRPKQTLKTWLNEGSLKGLESSVEQLPDDDKNKKTQTRTAAFTSVALPYGGYYVQRSGWGKDDLYCFMRSSRDGVGHNHNDNNSLQMVAYGAFMLIDGGEPNYSRPYFMVKHQLQYLPYFDEPQVGSVFNTNNVSIDDLEQRNPFIPLTNPTQGWTTPRKLLFHISPEVDLMEGNFDGYYQNEAPVSEEVIRNMVSDCGSSNMAEVITYNNKIRQTLPRIIRGQHNRKVFFMRQDKLWIVVDQTEGGNTATQTWHFPPSSEGTNSKSHICPGFDPNQVRLIQDEKRIFTISYYRPNISILNFYSTPLLYTKHFGDIFPFKGWYGFGIGGEREPAATVECKWSGSAPMVTALIPSKQSDSAPKDQDNLAKKFTSESNERGSGFVYSGNIATISFFASREPQRFSAENIEVVATLLLVRKSKDGVLTGCVIGGSEIMMAGVRKKVNGANFSFQVKDGNMITSFIEPPDTFRWVDNGDGQIKPSYK